MAIIIRERGTITTQGLTLKSSGQIMAPNQPILRNFWILGYNCANNPAPKIIPINPPLRASRFPCPMAADMVPGQMSYLSVNGK